MAKGGTGCLHNPGSHMVLTFPAVAVAGGERQRDGNVELDAGGIGAVNPTHVPKKHYFVTKALIFI